MLRMGEPAKAGPCITDNGNFIVDVDFGTITNPANLHVQLKLLTGVVETGLFIDMAEKGTSRQGGGGHTFCGCTDRLTCSLLWTRRWYSCHHTETMNSPVKDGTFQLCSALE